VLTFVLAGLALILEFKVKEPGVLLLAFVTIGTGIDFAGSLIDDYVTDKKSVLFYTKLRFSLLNFGILFTPLCAAYVLQYFPSAPISRALFSNFPLLLILSLVTGGLFMFARYVEDTEKGEKVYRLDRKDKFTKIAFIIRKTVLLCSLIIAIIAIAEGIGTEMALWSIMFGVVFIATIPLHILHKELPSMSAELATLVILLYGAGKVLL
jgi:hypothetical protein